MFFFCASRLIDAVGPVFLVEVAGRGCGFFRGNSRYSRNKYGFSAAGAELEDVWFCGARAGRKKGSDKGGNRCAAGNVVEKRAQISIKRRTDVNAKRSARRLIGG